MAAFSDAYGELMNSLNHRKEQVGLLGKVIDEQEKELAGKQMIIDQQELLIHDMNRQNFLLQEEITRMKRYGLLVD